jgi:hypothetical protein
VLLADMLHPALALSLLQALSLRICLFWKYGSIHANILANI